MVCCDYVVQKDNLESQLPAWHAASTSFKKKKDEKKKEKRKKKKKEKKKVR